MSVTARTAHLDTFARDHLPPYPQWPDFVGLEELGYPTRLNCAVELLDRAVGEGHGSRPCIITPSVTLSYAALGDAVDRIAHVLVRDLGLVPGERVLLRAPNCRQLAASWLAVVKAGGIAVATMPLLRQRELEFVIEKARVRLALCDGRLSGELAPLVGAGALQELIAFGDGGELEQRMRKHDDPFPARDTAADDVCLIAFTSGTTGIPKATVHFHRDILAVCDTYGQQVLQAAADDVFIGTPPLAFTFGLGGGLLFPLRVRAATVLLEDTSPESLRAGIERFRPTTLLTAPTVYRALVAADEGDRALHGLRRSVSAGEPLPLPVFEDWQQLTGLPILDGIGSTELLHIFIGAPRAQIRPGSTGLPVPGYQARVLGADGEVLGPGVAGRLAVRGPTGCRYLDDPRQREYVIDGWNITGDTYRKDEDGYFWFESRSDDMIISAGYNIAGPEVEAALLSHPTVAECAVVAAPDIERGHVVKAFVVLRDASAARSTELLTELQQHVKQTIAPYKYPRRIEFVDSLPRTETGKLQRFRLRQMEHQRAAAAAAR